MNNKKEVVKDPWFNLLPILSYSKGIFYFINTVRDIGKTWALKRYIWRRAVKHGKKAIYVRRFRKEVQAASQTFYSTSDIQKFCGGMEFYDPITKKGNIRQKGRTFYIKRNGKWDWFLKIIAISENQSLRSADDIDCDRIFFDEYTTTQSRAKWYHGNEAEDIIDLIVSMAREHDLKAIFCGNKECIDNPYFNYLNIPLLPSEYEGIRSFKHGTVIVQQINIRKPPKTDFHKRLGHALEGTQYGRYLEDAAYKSEPAALYAKTPPNANGYAQIAYKAAPLRITTNGQLFYVNTKPDYTAGLLVDTPRIAPYKCIVLNKKMDRNSFRALELAYRDGRIRYSCPVAYENLQPFLKYIGALN